MTRIKTDLYHPMRINATQEGVIIAARKDIGTYRRMALRVIGGEGDEAEEEEVLHGTRRRCLRKGGARVVGQQVGKVEVTGRGGAIPSGGTSLHWGGMGLG